MCLPNSGLSHGAAHMNESGMSELVENILVKCTMRMIMFVQPVVVESLLLIGIRINFTTLHRTKIHHI